MKRVKSKNTAPELRVRQLLRHLGYLGYRLHRSDIPGKPDIAWLSTKRAIFVHGCFWHNHACPRGTRLPKTNVEYWQKKTSRNKERDAQAQTELAASGWRVLIIWECELPDEASLSLKIHNFFADGENR